MISFLLRKLGYALLVLAGVVILTFILFKGLGDPSRLIAGQSGNRQTMENIRKDLYLDQPVWKQLLFYINDLSPLSFYTKETYERKAIGGFSVGRSTLFVLKSPYLGRSYQSRKDVASIILAALPGTIVLAVTAMIVACILGIALGLLAAVYKNTWIDSTAMITSIAGISAPSFFTAIGIAYLFGSYWHAYTGLHLTGSLFEIDEITGQRYLALQNLILPAITIGIRPMAMIAQLTRSSMLDVLNQDYIRTAYAKGLPANRVILVHALRNALNPVVTAITGWFAELLAGAFFVEYIFGWQGLGKITVAALEKLDYPVVMGSVLLSACIFIVLNFTADVLYRVADPRMRV